MNLEIFTISTPGHTFSILAQLPSNNILDVETKKKLNPNLNFYLEINLSARLRRKSSSTASENEKKEMRREKEKFSFPSHKFSANKERRKSFCKLSCGHPVRYGSCLLGPILIPFKSSIRKRP